MKTRLSGGESGQDLDDLFIAVMVGVGLSEEGGR
jgi:hypothetical protein